MREVGAELSITPLIIQGRELEIGGFGGEGIFGNDLGIAQNAEECGSHATHRHTQTHNHKHEQKLPRYLEVDVLSILAMYSVVHTNTCTYTPPHVHDIQCTHASELTQWVDVG